MAVLSSESNATPYQTVPSPPEMHTHSQHPSHSLPGFGGLMVSGPNGAPGGGPVGASGALALTELQTLVFEYLTTTGQSSTVTISSAKVAQKSYRSEKRWITPPPLVAVSGGAWPSSVSISAFMRETSALANTLEPWLDATDAHATATPRHTPAVFGRLFVPDSQQDEESQSQTFSYLSLFFSIFSPARPDAPFGLFKSSQLKLIPKPTRTTRDVELHITTGSKVSLFVRPRSQTLVNKYLNVGTDNNITASADLWTDFIIRDVNGAREGSVVSYGHQIVLQSEDGITTNALTLRRLEKGKLELNNSDPVCNLHHVALQLTGTDLFLAVEKDGLALRSAGQIVDGMLIDHSANWTIVATDTVVYKFHAPPTASLPLTPIPSVIRSVVCTSATSSAPSLVQQTKLTADSTIALHGKNFSQNITVFFGTQPVPTVYRCEELMIASIPPVSQICASPQILSVPAYCEVKIDVPLTLVRCDGVIFPTSVKFAYEVQPLSDYRSLQPALYPQITAARPF
eukprot:TRINITY_DN5121_c0_g1_i1.p1 TRINITY_DN5121_c0_g1~~TRINITY_DN5121_c0_g1_i1.p1  ORF type:complete len:593 (-),score=109.55 TRINITY_DN5121_c0_g1_i1:41-1582(-)